jgi:2-polyprenyl-3-methyl-5-hydroxy-6-metoxy-1,4-benzoquinol methylase
MSPQQPAHDAETLAFYDREAPKYAARKRSEQNPRLDAFLAKLHPGARILELGCGGGQDSEVMIKAGFDVTPTDGSQGLAKVAEDRLGRPVKVLKFEELDEHEAYDAVWAHACLLHVPEQRLGDVLARIRRALKPGGRFFASYKSGEGGERDNLGRYYNFPSPAGLKATYEQVGPWASLDLEDGPGGGYDGVARTFLFITVTKPV